MFTDRLRETMSVIDCLEIPTIAVVNGKVIGGGFEFMLSFDFRIAHPNSVFRLP